MFRLAREVYPALDAGLARRVCATDWRGVGRKNILRIVDKKRKEIYYLISQSLM